MSSAMPKHDAESRIEFGDVADVPGSYEFLYELLRNRGPNVSISHQRMPTYVEHLNFCENHPYRAWKIISLKSSKAFIGAIYLTDGSFEGQLGNEIGIFLHPNYQKMGFGPEAIRKLMREFGDGRYYLNVNPKNTFAEGVYRLMGFDVIQKTYFLDFYKDTTREK